MKTKTLKEQRWEIYNYIQENIGECTTNQIWQISKLVKEYGKMSNNFTTQHHKNIDISYSKLRQSNIRKEKCLRRLEEELFVLKYEKKTIKDLQ